MDIRLVAIVGKAHSGKTTLANALVRDGFQRFAFADPVKDVSADMLNTFVGYLTGVRGTYTRNDINAMKGNPAIRKLLQLVGTELGREWLGPESIWIDLFAQDVEDARKTAETTGRHLWIICDDCRFENEATRLRDLDFVIVKIVRDENERIESIRNAMRTANPTWGKRRIKKELKTILSHPSETNVDLITPDFEIESTSVAQLENEIAPLFFESAERTFAVLRDSPYNRLA